VAYCLQTGEAVADGLKRIAEEQMGLAAQHLGSGASLEERVHEARKNLKKARAVLRLVKEELGPEYGEENRRLRDVGRHISALRDTHATLKVLDEFAAKQRMKRRLAGVRTELEQSRMALEGQPEWAVLLPELGAALKTVSRRIEDWPLRATTMQALGKGLSISYQRAREALAAARKGGDPEQFHELRKRTKTHLYQLRVMDGISGGRWRNRIAELKKLSDCIGQQHDLIVLLPKLAGNEEAQARAEKQRRRLEAVALRMAESLYGPKSVSDHFEDAGL
jgi:CHAD domain-containing protein